jgi:hypothetical protein
LTKNTQKITKPRPSASPSPFRAARLHPGALPHHRVPAGLEIAPERKPAALGGPHLIYGALPLLFIKKHADMIIFRSFFPDGQPAAHPVQARADKISNISPEKSGNTFNFRAIDPDIAGFAAAASAPAVPAGRRIEAEIKSFLLHQFRHSPQPASGLHDDYSC